MVHRQTRLFVLHLGLQLDQVGGFTIFSKLRNTSMLVVSHNFHKQHWFSNEIYTKQPRIEPCILDHRQLQPLQMTVRFHLVVAFFCTQRPPTWRSVVRRSSGTAATPTSFNGALKPHRATMMTGIGMIKKCSNPEIVIPNSHSVVEWIRYFLGVLENLCFFAFCTISCLSDSKCIFFVTLISFKSPARRRNCVLLPDF